MYEGSCRWSLTMSSSRERTTFCLRVPQGRAPSAHVGAETSASISWRRCIPGSAWQTSPVHMTARIRNKFPVKATEQLQYMVIESDAGGAKESIRESTTRKFACAMNMRKSNRRKATISSMPLW